MISSSRDSSSSSGGGGGVVVVVVVVVTVVVFTGVPTNGRARLAKRSTCTSVPATNLLVQLAVFSRAKRSHPLPTTQHIARIGFFRSLPHQLAFALYNDDNFGNISNACHRSSHGGSFFEVTYFRVPLNTPEYVI